MSNYPDDIRQYDSDPRSPFYDDGGFEEFVDERVEELMEAHEEIEDIELDVIGESMIDIYMSKDYTQSSLHNHLTKYLEELAVKQAEREFQEER